MSGIIKSKKLECVSGQFLDPAYFAALEFHFDSVWVETAGGQNSLDFSLSQCTGALVLLLHYQHACADSYFVPRWYRIH
jgi:hypothetical protein